MQPTVHQHSQLSVSQQKPPKIASTTDQNVFGSEIVHDSRGLETAPLGTLAEDIIQDSRKRAKMLHQQLPVGIRWLCLVSGLGLLSLLATARYLTPSPAGLGTHQQLGLPPCTTMVIWNVPCPTCGMTTSWAWVMRGNLMQASRANLGGTMLAIIAIGFLPAACYFFISGRATSGHWFSLMLAVSLVTACCITLIQWAIRLA